MITQRLNEKLTMTFLLQLLCTSLTMILLYQEVVTYTVTRPTTSSSEQTALDEDTFPKVTVCLDPALSKEKAKKYGYDVNSYYRGELRPKNGFVGWNGVATNESSFDILEDILTLKHDMTLFNAWYTGDDSHGDEYFANISYTKPTYPFGRCFVVSPFEIKLKNIETMIVLFPPINSGLSSEYKPSLIFHLEDTANSIQVYPEGFHMQGRPIKMKIKANNSQSSSHYKLIYKIRISRSYHVPGDSHQDCTEYSNNQTYNDCVQDEIGHVFLQAIGCVPPLLAKNKTNMCNRVFNMADNEGDVISHLLYRIYSVGFKSVSCKTPCTTTTFTSELVTKAPSSVDVLILAFNPVVSVTRTSFSISPQTLVTRLGGSVSSGRTLLWALVALMAVLAEVKNVWVMCKRATYGSQAVDEGWD